MGRAERRQKDEGYLRKLEAQFGIDLVRALREAANGNWGVFGSYLDHAEQRKSNAIYYDLHAKADEITELRQRLGITDQFRPLERYLQYCKRHDQNDPGEPKLAREFLDELTAGLPRDTRQG